MFFYALNKLVCPKTFQNLKCDVFESENIVGLSGNIEKCRNYCGYKGMSSNEVSEGTCIECQKIRVVSGRLYTEDRASEYPVINGVPRMLLGVNVQELKEDYKSYFESFRTRFEHYLDESEMSISHFDVLQSKTQESFGNEWEKFNTILPSYEEIFNEYFRAAGVDALKGKFILDAGCGMGRWAYFAAKYSKEVFAVDFSKAVDEAVRNLKEFKNAHVIQADIYNLPFRNEEFDIAYSLGVLHHLPSPFDGFKNIVNRAKKNGGGVLVYLYYALDNKSFIWRLILSLVTMGRRITTKLPKVIHYPLCFGLSVIFKALFVIPSDIFSRLGMEKVADSIPLNYYKDKTFKILYNDTIDRFSAPVENRYSRSQIREWYRNVGIDECIIPDERPYWCAYGIRKD